MYLVSWKPTKILNHTKIFVGATVDGRNPANPLILSLSQYLQGVYISQVVGRIHSINSIDSIDLAKVRYAYAGMFAFLGPGSLNEICVFVLQRAFVLSLLVNCEFCTAHCSTNDTVLVFRT